jgi:hypothetical protein
MADYRDPNDPSRRQAPFDPNVQGATGAWGWVTGAVLVVIVLAAIFGLGHAPDQAGKSTLAKNTPPSAQTAPAPASPASRAYSPAPLTPGAPAPRHPAPSQQK